MASEVSIDPPVNRSSISPDGTAVSEKRPLLSTGATSVVPATVTVMPATDAPSRLTTPLIVAPDDPEATGSGEGVSGDEGASDLVQPPRAMPAVKIVTIER